VLAARRGAESGGTSLAPPRPGCQRELSGLARHCPSGHKHDASPHGHEASPIVQDFQSFDSAPGTACPVAPAPPARRLSTLATLKSASTDSLRVFDAELFDKLVVARRYWWRRVFFVSDPEGVKRVLLDNFANYPRVGALRRLFGRGLGTGSLASEGEVWRQHRRVGAPALDHRAIAADIPAMIALMEAEADALGRDLRETPFDLERWLQPRAIRLLNTIVTGGDPAAEPMLTVLAKFPRRPHLSDLLPLPERLRPRWLDRRATEIAAFDPTLYALVDARLAPDYAGPHDLIWRLAHPRGERTAASLPRDEIRDEVASMVSAGVSATVRGLQWVWYLLALHPGVEARLHDEIDRELDGRPPLPEQLPRLRYTRQVIDEAMRLYPPVPAMVREAVADDAICGRRVPRRSVIVISPWVIHRHKLLWPDPRRFDPDRFAPENAALRPRFAYLPFAGGPRICVGAALAISQMLIVVAALARRYRFRLAPGHTVEPVGGITLRPRGGLKVIVEPREGAG
jgi:cytochrome P450